MVFLKKKVAVMKKTKLFSVSMKDCQLQTFCTGGAGGQNQNKNQKGVRIVHKPSNAVGEGREYKSQLQNKKAAFRRLADSKEFKLWVKREASKLEGKPSIEELVEEEIQEKNLKIEIKDQDGNWVLKESWVD